jgi:hypothetical protein
MSRLHEGFANAQNPENPDPLSFVRYVHHMYYLHHCDHLSPAYRQPLQCQRQGKSSRFSVLQRRPIVDGDVLVSRRTAPRPSAIRALSTFRPRESYTHWLYPILVPADKTDRLTLTFGELSHSRRSRRRNTAIVLHPVASEVSHHSLAVFNRWYAPLLLTLT